MRHRLSAEQGDRYSRWNSGARDLAFAQVSARRYDAVNCVAATNSEHETGEGLPIAVSGILNPVHMQLPRIVAEGVP